MHIESLNTIWKLFGKSFSKIGMNKTIKVNRFLEEKKPWLYYAILHTYIGFVANILLI